MNKIMRVSLFFRVLFQISFIVLPVLLIIAWVKAPLPLLAYANGIELDMIPRSYPIMHVLSPTTKVLGFLISMIPVGVVLLVLYFLIKLFRLYEQGEIFSSKNVSYISKVGYTLFIGQLINPIYDALISAALTWANPHGHRLAQITFDGTNAGVLLIALLVILISWIMAEACKLREEQQLTI